MNKTLSMAASLLLASICVAQSAAPTQPRHDHAVAATQDAPASSRVIMGVYMEEVDEALAQQLGVDPDSVVLIEDVMPEYGAAKAGIKKHDVIKAIDGQSPVSIEIVRKLLAKKKPGDKIKVTYIRGRDTSDVEVELMAAKDSGPSALGGLAAVTPQGGRGSTGARAAEPRPPLSGTRAGSDPMAVNPTTSGWLWRAQDEEQLRSAVQRLRDQLRVSEQDVGKRTREMAKESQLLAEKLLRMAHDKAVSSFNEERVKKLTDAATELAERSREKLEVDLRDLLEKHRDTLDKSMRDLEKLLGRLPSSEAVRAAREYTTRVSQPNSVARPAAGGGQGGLPNHPAPVQTGQLYSGQPFGQAPLAVISDSGKALKKVDERLENIDERLEKIEQMLEKLLGRGAPKSTK